MAGHDREVEVAWVKIKGVVVTIECHRGCRHVLIRLQFLWRILLQFNAEHTAGVSLEPVAAATGALFLGAKSHDGA